MVNIHQAVPVEDDPNKGIGFINYCVTGDMQSTCGVTSGCKWKDHRNCKYSFKSKNLDRCMHLRWDEYCTSHDAIKAKAK